MITTPSQWQTRLLRSKWLPVIVIAITLSVLGGTMYFAKWQLRKAVRDQIVRRDAEVLDAVLQTLILENDSGSVAESTPDDLGSQFDLILKASRIKGVMGVRLFSAKGNLVNTFPANVTGAKLDPPDLDVLKKFKPVSHYRSDMQLSKILIGTGDDKLVPLLEVMIPLHQRESNRLVGIAQFILEGSSITAEYAKLDQHLNSQAAMAFLSGAVLLVLALGWAFRKLSERTAHLQKANQQLALAARTSAVGAVASHLIHGLKNPLSVLQLLVSTRSGSSLNDDPHWEMVVSSAQKMQSMINEVVSVIREEQHEHHYQLTLDEVAEMTIKRIQANAKERGIRFECNIRAEGELNNRTANLVGLILVNLIQNAIQASPRGGVVKLEMLEDGKNIVCEVTDQGPGMPEHILNALFSPCVSTKQGGSGIGMAISKQLANHLEAELTLKSSTSNGCCFALIIPEKLLLDQCQACQDAEKS
jgi:signal transduction histidine kinase